MDIFNRKKVKELQERICCLEDELREYEEEKQKKKDGTHITGNWCNGCEHLRVTGNIATFPPARFCILDNPCKDRKGR